MTVVASYTHFFVELVSFWLHMLKAIDSMLELVHNVHDKGVITVVSR